MSRRIHLYNDTLPAFENVVVTSVVVRDEYDPDYRIVRPCERVETTTHRVPLGATLRQQTLIAERNDAFNRTLTRRHE